MIMRKLFICNKKDGEFWGGDETIDVFFVLSRVWDEYKISIFRVVLTDMTLSTSPITGFSSLFSLRIFFLF